MQNHRGIAGVGVSIGLWLACVCGRAGAPLPATLRGNDYLVIGTSMTLTSLYPAFHSTSPVTTLDPDVYSTATVAADFAQMRALEYNCIRTFINSRWNIPGEVAAGSRLNARFVDNLVDLLRRARDNGLFVVGAFGYVPSTYYDAIEEVVKPGTEIYDPAYATAQIELPEGSGRHYAITQSPFAEGSNEIFAHKGLLRAQAQYVIDVLDAIAARDASLIAGRGFAVEVLNEPFLTCERFPFSMTTGTLTVALDTTATYNMTISDPANQRQKLADDMTRHWLDRVLTPIKARYPDVPLVVSAFTPYVTGRSQATAYADAQGGGYTGVRPYPYLPDMRQPLRVSVLNDSAADVISLNCSPVAIGEEQYRIATDMRSAELDRITLKKKLILGEFWAWPHDYPTIEKAVAGMIAHQTGSVAYGCSGWIYWTWDTQAWSAKSAGGAIGNAMSPLFRPDPAATQDVKIIRPTGDEAWAIGSSMEIEWMSNMATAGGDCRFDLTVNGAPALGLGTAQAAGGHGRLTVTVPDPGGAKLDGLRAASVARPDLFASARIQIVAVNAARGWSLYK